MLTLYSALGNHANLAAGLNVDLLNHICEHMILYKDRFEKHFPKFCIERIYF